MGFEPAHAATIRVDPDARVATHEQRNAYFDEVLRRVKEIPGVESAAITDALPLGSNRSWGARAKGVTYERGRAPVGVRARGHRRLSGGDGHAARRRPRLLRARHADQRAGDADQRDDGPHRVSRAGSDRPGTSSAAARRNGASSAWSATCATSRSSRRRATRCICRCGSAAISRRRIWWCDRRSRPSRSPARVARGPPPDRTEPEHQRLPHACSRWSTSRSRRGDSW